MTAIKRMTGWCGCCWRCNVRFALFHLERAAVVAAAVTVDLVLVGIVHI
jgi:hypothetical protein